MKNFLLSLLLIGSLQFANAQACSFTPAPSINVHHGNDTIGNQSEYAWICTGSHTVDVGYQFGNGTFLVEAGGYLTITGGMGGSVFVNPGGHAIDQAPSNGNRFYVAAGGFLDSHGYYPEIYSQTGTFITYTGIPILHSCTSFSINYTSAPVNGCAHPTGIDEPNNEIVFGYYYEIQSGQITVNTTLPETYTMQVIDMTGKNVIAKENINQSVLDFNVNQLPAGVYLIKLNTNEGRTAVKKFLKP